MPSACWARVGFSGKFAAIAWNAVHVALPNARLSGGFSNASAVAAARTLALSCASPNRASKRSEAVESPQVHECRSCSRPKAQSKAPVETTTRRVASADIRGKRRQALRVEIALVTELARWRASAQSIHHPTHPHRAYVVPAPTTPPAQLTPSVLDNMRLDLQTFAAIDASSTVSMFACQSPQQFKWLLDRVYLRFQARIFLCRRAFSKSRIATFDFESTQHWHLPSA
jgi:hypothetical protein